jgi:hypothetical protein
VEAHLLAEKAQIQADYFNPQGHVHSPDLAPSDFHLFLRLNKFLADQRFLNNDDIREAVNKCQSEQAATFYEKGIQKLVPCYYQCVNNGEKYVEKQLKIWQS